MEKREFLRSKSWMKNAKKKFFTEYYIAIEIYNLLHHFPSLQKTAIVIPSNDL